MIWSKLRVSQSNFNIGMAQYPLKHNDVAALHHEMRSGGMTQNMYQLARKCLDPRALQSLSKR